MTAEAEVQPAVDVFDPDLTPAERAIIQFFAARLEHWENALSRHVPDADGYCYQCRSLRHPCLTWTLADAARRTFYPDVPLPRQEQP